MEDLNYLILRQQEERSRAEGASCPEAREAHEKLAEFYENRIRAGAPLLEEGGTARSDQ